MFFKFRLKIKLIKTVNAISAFRTLSATLRRMRHDPNPNIFRIEKLVLWYVTSYVSRSTAAHFLQYPVSKAAFMLPLPLEIAHMHDYGKN